MSLNTEKKTQNGTVISLCSLWQANCHAEGQH